MFDSLHVAQSTISSAMKLSADVATKFQTLNQYTYVVKDFGKVFEKYIHN